MITSQIYAKWKTLCIVADIPDSWRDHPSLADLDALEDVGKRHVVDPSAVTAALCEVMRCTPDEVTETALLITHIPLVLHLAHRTVAHHDCATHQDVCATVATEVWLTLMGHSWAPGAQPSQRTLNASGAATRIRLDALHRITAESRRRRVDQIPVPPDTVIDLTAAEATPAAPTSEEEIAALLDWAVEHDHLSAHDADFLGAWVDAQHHQGTEQVAAAYGLSWPAARKRASRIIARLTRAAPELSRSMLAEAAA